MKAVTDRITAFLSERDNHCVSVSQGDRRLAKTSMPKYSFSLADIQTLYGSVADFVKAIPENGFTENVKITLRSIYGSGANATAITRDTLTLNFTKKTEAAMPMPVTAEPQNDNLQPMTPQQPTYQPHPQPVPALGYAHIPQTDWINYEVSKQRLEDLKKEHTRLENELQDAKSEIRQLKEENFSLRVKIDTSDEKHAVDLEKERLRQKSFLDSEAMKSFTEIGGRLAGAFFGKQMGMSSETVAALASPAGANVGGSSEISQIKQDLIAYICSDSVTDELATQVFNQIYTE